MITYQVENQDELAGELQPLLEKHYEEISATKGSFALSPDWMTYIAMRDSNTIHVITARDEGKLIGYSIYFLSKNLHYANMIVAETDVFFLLPEYRKGFVGIKLMKFSEEALKKIGVNYIVSKVKLKHDVGVIFDRLGYQPIERVYAKTL